MARRRSGNCNSCGAPAAIDPNTFKVGRLCAACAAPAVSAARKATRASYRDDKETVVTVSPVDSAPLSGLANGPYRCIDTYRGEVWVNNAGEPI